MGLLWESAAAPAARVLLAYLLFWWLLFKIPTIFFAPTVEASWSVCGETAVMVAGAWVLYARFSTEWDKQRFGFATGDQF